MSNIYGTIGYVFLSNENRKIIILADQHDKLPDCDDKINISEWFKKKINSSKILLEEVPRENNKLIELWQESPHTQELKNLYLANPTIIPGMDIRPFMIPFSWEVLDQINIQDNNYNIDMIEYLKEIDYFFSLDNTNIISKLSNYNINKLINTLLGKHFILIKNRFSNLLEELNKKDLLNKKIIYLHNDYINELLKINNLLDDIMEWYICAHIDLYKNKSIIIHAGLAHTEKIVRLLISHYNFEIKYEEGTNTIDSINNNSRTGCINIPIIIDNQFGGIN